MGETIEAELNKPINSSQRGITKMSLSLKTTTYSRKPAFPKFRRRMFQEYAEEIRGSRRIVVIEVGTQETAATRVGEEMK